MKNDDSSMHLKKMKNKTNGPVTCRTLGPVPDLERHLPSDWWKTLFNSVYLKTDGDVVEHYENTQAEIDFVIRLASLEKNDRILDLCCGQGRHCLELARRGFKNVVGIDSSRYLIRLARKRAKQENLEIEFREGDARKLRIRDRQFNCVTILGNSFGYFEQKEDDVNLLKGVSQCMSNQGIILMDIVDGAWMRENFVPRSWEWIDQNHFVCRERSLSKDGDRLVAREVIVHAEKGVIVDQFYAERLYDREQILNLLDRTGFRMVRFHGHIQTESSRNQDLGMMANRILLTAVAPEKAVTKSPSKTKPIFPHVTVILGDPTLPDKVKVNGKFNELDLDTVEKMKHALSELKDYEFQYIDNHQTLLRFLTSTPPEFVLNLCDEGYYNDPFKELHIPSILEIMSVPYSGAGPSCLGLCYNKGLVKSIAETLEIPVPMESYIGPDDVIATIPSTLPALIKPNFGDSSVGITVNSIVNNQDELLGYIDELRRTLGKYPVLVQEFLTGTEYSVGIIGNPGMTYKVLPPLEVDYSKLDPNLPKILGYESKWLANSPYWTQIAYKEAQITEEVQRKLFDYSNLLFERLGCRDYARFDFRADANGVIKFLEANPNPGWCWDGKFNMMAELSGMRYADLLRAILEIAQERFTVTCATSPSTSEVSCAGAEQNIPDSVIPVQPSDHRNTQHAV